MYREWLPNAKQVFLIGELGSLVMSMAISGTDLLEVPTIYKAHS